MKWTLFVNLDEFGVMIGWIGVFMSTAQLIVSIGEIVHRMNADRPQNGHWLVVLWMILISSAFLVVGVLSDNHLMLLPWLMTTWILLFFHMSLLLRYIDKVLDMKAEDWNSVHTEYIIGYIIVALMSLGFHYYANFAIHALYSQIANKYVNAQTEPMTTIEV